MTRERRLYLAAAMSAGRDAAHRISLIAAAVEAASWRILNRQVVDPTADFADRASDRDQRIFERDMSWLAECDAMIAEISTPSHGVGFEVAEALRLGKPVLCLRDRALAGVLASAMLLGNPSPLIVSRHCADEEIAPLVAAFLAQG